jgi:hypothetical protein
MSNWVTYDEGRSIGYISADGGTILWDEEHKLGARITLKRSDSFTSIACQIYNRIDHTRFLGVSSDEEREYKAMRTALADIMIVIDSAGQNDIKVWEAIAEFVKRFS